ncbi:MAG: QueT transporter family protein, partial [Clostridia bacterium]|nr:QueT transporter family protein [Clostridia bacterium]
CITANLLTGCAPWDVVFGSLATLIGAVGTYYLGKICKGRLRFLTTLPPIIANTVIVPFVIRYVYASEDALPFLFFTVGIGEVISCGIMGFFLIKILDKYKDQIF